MRCSLNLLASAAIACVGCADSPGSLAAPLAPRPSQWQQFCEQAWNVPQASALVAARGVGGWELVAMYNGVLCYKRPVPDSSPARPPGAQPWAGSYGQGGRGSSRPIFFDPGF
jgi:hypothetical protein